MYHSEIHLNPWIVKPKHSISFSGILAETYRNLLVFNSNIPLGSHSTAVSFLAITNKMMELDYFNYYFDNELIIHRYPKIVVLLNLGRASLQITIFFRFRLDGHFIIIKYVLVFGYFTISLLQIISDDFVQKFIVFYLSDAHNFKYRFPNVFT